MTGKASEFMAGIEGHDALADRRRGQEQRPQVLAEDLDRLAVGALLERGTQLVFQRRAHQALPSVDHGRPQLGGEDALRPRHDPRRQGADDAFVR